ncbi:MAG: zf-TFIIB domain-containing protein [Acidobacteria bacterium]|nr:zf-TFIIB domain-containing protein [Acidobacteriota bacterium]
MSAQLLQCPACGAPATAESARCDYCGSMLATGTCPSCFAKVLAAAKFCSHCGATAVHAQPVVANNHLCPRCRVAMQAMQIGDSNLRECPRCDGIWADPETLQGICTRRERQAAVLTMPAPACEAPGLEKNFRYVPCPVCHKLMNRVNFAQGCHIVLDVCKAHGTWFDRDELRRTVEFITAGGLEKARAYQIAQLKEERRRLELSKDLGPALQIAYSPDWQPDGRDLWDDFLHALFS